MPTTLSFQPLLAGSASLTASVRSEESGVNELDGVDLKRWLELLEWEGPNLPRPYADVVRGKIRELRVSFSGLHHRFLYVFHGKRIVVTHGFIKKTAEIPEAEIARAERYTTDFYRRLEGGEIHL